jgi:hypothetical protein
MAWSEVRRCGAVDPVEFVDPLPCPAMERGRFIAGRSSALLGHQLADRAARRDWFRGWLLTALGGTYSALGEQLRPPGRQVSDQSVSQFAHAHPHVDRHRDDSKATR